MYALFKLDHKDSDNEFLVSTIFWDVSEEYVFNCTRRVVETLSHLKEKFIKWLSTKAKKRESLSNNSRQQEFIEVVSKINETDIVLINKSDDKYEEELFSIEKRDTSWIFVLYVIQKRSSSMSGFCLLTSFIKVRD